MEIGMCSPIINLYKLMEDRKLPPKFDHTFIINFVDLVACCLLPVLYIIDFLLFKPNLILIDLT